jgi:uncharacterized phage protein (TIGR01671 family)
MNRPIIFRVWDKKNKVFVLNSDSLSWIQGKEQGTFEPWLLKNYKLMQFTGLLDENGKEIYEDDIVDWRRLPRIVFWNEAEGSWYTKEPTGEGKDESLKGAIENGYFIIGNVWEHPELLTPKQ